MRAFLGTPWRTARVARLALAAALVIGYADLLRGGLTVAPLVLVAAYLVLAPVALFAR